MKFRKNLTERDRLAAAHSQIGALEVVVAEQRKQIRELKALVKFQAKQLRLFVPVGSRVTKSCDGCGRPLEAVTETVSNVHFPCGVCGQGYAVPLLLQTTAPSSLPPQPAGIGAASAQSFGVGEARDE